LELGLAAINGMVADMEINTAVLKKAAGLGFSTATDLADWLVRMLDIPFRNAHHITGQAVALAEKKGVTLERLSLADYQSIHEGITKDVYDVLSVDKSVKSRTSFGGTAPVQVKKQISYWKKRIIK
jgi:argininosuccinate lyase